jgi:hypothetical protein
VSESLKWIKSSYSSTGNCLEVATGDQVLVRDTQDRSGSVLEFSPSAWIRFTTKIKTS